MVKKLELRRLPRRKLMKRVQRLRSARGGLEAYEGNNVVKAYRNGIDFNTAFTEPEILGVAIDPNYKERVLQSVAVQAAAKRQKRARERRDGPTCGRNTKMTLLHWSGPENVRAAMLRQAQHR